MRETASLSNGVVDDAQIREQILDFLALVELEAAEHLVRHAVLGKFLLVCAGERVDAHEDGEVGKAVPLAHEVADGARDPKRLVVLRFRLVVLRLAPLAVLRPQHLVLAAAVVADDGIGEL